MRWNSGVGDSIKCETKLNVKPAVGFMLPSAGVTPAPGIKKDKMRDFVPVWIFFGVVLFLAVYFFLEFRAGVIVERSENPGSLRTSAAEAES